MGTKFDKYLGKMVFVAHKRPGGNVFYMRGELLDATDSHIFVFSGGKTQALLLSECAKIEILGGDTL